MWLQHSVYLLMLIMSADSSRGDSSWFDCGTQHVCKIFSDLKNWHDAEAFCNTEFGHLASIVTVADDRGPIASKASALNITDYWIGLNHLGGLQDHWRFTDGETVDGGLWATGYPATKYNFGLIEMCGTERAGGFHNEHCDKENQYVCKKQRGATESSPPTATKVPLDTLYCPVGYTSIDPRQEPNMGEKCFKFVFLDLADGVDWYEAVRRCRVPGRKSDIASIHGPYEHEFVRSKIVNRTFDLWIGLHRTWGGESGWKWLDNSAYNSTDANWDVGQPNYRHEKCAEVLSMPSDGKWNNAHCSGKRFGYICQIFKDSNNPVMEPPPTPQQNCLEGYTPYEYGCYRLLNNIHMSWAEMRDECRSHSTNTIQSDLASVHSSAEDATLHIQVMQSGGSAWIGFKENMNNEFDWSNGWYPTYTNWGSTEGDDGIHLGCVAMDSGPNGGWYEVECNTPLAAICKTTDDEPTEAPSVKNGSCPGEADGFTSWLKHESYCYLPVSQAKSWHDARLHCAKTASAATLVSIHSENENKFVYENMPTVKDRGWIGLFLHNKDKRFFWTDGSHFHYVKWYLWALHDISEECISLRTSGRFRSDWANNLCSNQYPFMCKVKQGMPIQRSPDHVKPCPDGWHKFGASCYLPFPLKLMKWRDAEEHCQRKSGNRAHLPTITNKFQQEFLSDLMIPGYTTETTSYWIGLKQGRGELVYNWVGTGDEYDPSGFNLFENGLIRPNMTVEQCVAMIDHPSTNTGLWNMASCDQPAAYVCELPLETAVVAATEGENVAIVIPIFVTSVGVGIFLFIVVILVRKGDTLFKEGNRTERTWTTTVIKNESDKAPLSWTAGEKGIYLTHPEHGKRTTPVNPNEDYGSSYSREPGTDECVVYTSHLLYGNLPTDCELIVN